MAEIVYSARAVESLEHAFDRVSGENHVAALPTVEAIESAVNHLAAHPLIGRRVAGEIRELVISFGETGYIALYRFIPQRDQVRVLAIRHQRAIGYTP